MSSDLAQYRCFHSILALRRNDNEFAPLPRRKIENPAHGKDFPSSLAEILIDDVLTALKIGAQGKRCSVFVS